MTTSSDLVLSTASPEPHQLWAPAGMLSPDWSAPIRVTRGWNTAIESAIDDSEQRFSGVHAPAHSVSCMFTTYDEATLISANTMLNRASTARFLWPLWCDFSKLTAAALPGDGSLSFDTTTRRFNTGQRIMIVVGRGAASSLEYEINEILSITESSVMLQNTLTMAHDAGSRVYPLVECDHAASSSGNMLTDQAGSFTLTALESHGPHCLDSLEDLTDVPSIDGYPLLAGQVNWSDTQQLGLISPTIVTASGKSSIIGPRRGSTRRTIGVPYTLTTREMWRRLTAVLDYTRGRAKPIFILEPTNDVELWGGSNSSIVKVNRPIEDWARVKYVGAVMRDGTTNLARLTSVSRNTLQGFDILNLSANLGSPDQIRRIAPLKLCRLTADSWTETWTTDQACRVDVGFTEIDPPLDAPDIILPSPSGGLPAGWLPGAVPSNGPSPQNQIDLTIQGVATMNDQDSFMFGNLHPFWSNAFAPDASFYSTYIYVREASDPVYSLFQGRRMSFSIPSFTPITAGVANNIHNGYYWHPENVGAIYPEDGPASNFSAGNGVWMVGGTSPLAWSYGSDSRLDGYGEVPTFPAGNLVGISNRLMFGYNIAAQKWDTMFAYAVAALPGNSPAGYSGHFFVSERVAIPEETGQTITAFNHGRGFNANCNEGELVDQRMGLPNTPWMAGDPYLPRNFDKNGRGNFIFGTGGTCTITRR